MREVDNAENRRGQASEEVEKSPQPRWGNGQQAAGCQSFEKTVLERHGEGINLRYPTLTVVLDKFD